MKLFKFFLNVIFTIMLTLSLFGCDKTSSNQQATDSSAASDSSQTEKNSDDYIFPDSDTTLLTEDKLDDLPLKTLELGRNEIFARHGYVFKTEELKTYFSKKPWYTANSSFNSEKDLNATEGKNVALIKSVEDKKTNTKTDAKTDVKSDEKSSSKTYGRVKQVTVENGARYIVFDKVEWLSSEDIKKRQDVKDYLVKQYGNMPTEFDDDYYIYDPDSNLTKLPFSANGAITNWKFDDTGIQTFSISFEDLQNDKKQNNMLPQDGIYSITIENNTIVKLDKMYQP